MRGNFPKILFVFSLFLTALVSWWGYALFSKQEALLALELSRGLITEEQKSQFNNDTLWMLLGEGGTLLLCINGGLAFIYRLYRKSLRQQHELNTLFTLWTHESKTPLASIQLQTETLLLKNASPEARKYLERTLQECARLQLFLDRILQLVRTQHKPLSMSPGPIASDLESWWTHDAPESLKEKISFQWSSPPDFQALCLREPHALSHIFNNIFENASRHSSGSILRVELSSLQRSLSLNFQSSGPGFEDKTISDLGNTPFLPSESGFGLGLYLIAQLMNKMGGSVRFYNHDKGKDACVELLFPKEKV